MTYRCADCGSDEIVEHHTEADYYPNEDRWESGFYDPTWMQCQRCGSRRIEDDGNGRHLE